MAKKKYGIGKNPNSHLRGVYKVNSKFFNKPNLNNSYWAGFIAADGNIRRETVLRIKLSTRERGHLDIFSKQLAFGGKIHTYEQRSKKGTYADYVEMSFASKEICDDLNKHWNIVARKTYDYCMPKIQDKGLLDAFIVGYIDGDGTVEYYRKKRGIASLSMIVVGRMCVLEVFKSRFEEILSDTSPNITKEGSSKQLHRLGVSGKKAVKLYKHFQSIAVPKLKRKWDYYPKSTWGYERWATNNDKYCGKLLYFNKNKRCSWHYHRIKDETFYVSSGKAIIKHSFEDDINNACSTLLKKGDTFHVPVGMRHQVIALEDTEILEISTTHFEDDSYRLIKGD